jgi:hypothetical protein
VGAILLLIIIIFIIFFSVGWAAEKATISHQDPVALADEPTSRKVLYIVEVVDNSGYIINFWVTASEFDSRMPTVQRMIDSFEFVGLSNDSSNTSPI